MTLEEAIKQSEDIADANERIADIYKNHDKDFEEARRSTTKYYRQLAEWLRELKALRESEAVQNEVKNCDTCKYDELEPDEYPCETCCHRYINQYVYDDTREQNTEEVKADDE